MIKYIILTVCPTIITEKKHKFLEFILIFLHLQENNSMTVTSRGDLNDLVDEGKNSQFMEVLYRK